MTFGEIIKKQRDHKKMSQHTLADNIKEKYDVRLSTSYISMIETNTRTNLTVNLINALLEYLELPPEAAYSLFARKEPSPKWEATTKVQTQYMLEKEKEVLLAYRLSPPEIRRAMDEIYNLLMAKYTTK
jgi:transcriptional regulator with XRE-family HTH domain